MIFLHTEKEPVHDYVRQAPFSAVGAPAVRSPQTANVGAPTCVKNNIVYILCKDILYTLCKHIIYKFLLIEALIFLLNEDRCESDKPVSSGILAYLRQSSR